MLAVALLWYSTFHSPVHTLMAGSLFDQGEEGEFAHSLSHVMDVALKSHASGERCIELCVNVGLELQNTIHTSQMVAFH